jgi:hypothetical protein
MIKTNVLLNAVSVILMAVLCYFGKCVWEDLAAIKTASTSQAVQMISVVREVDDHETRIRLNERDITILQQAQREDRTARSPKMLDNSKN